MSKREDLRVGMRVECNYGSRCLGVIFALEGSGGGDYVTIKRDDGMSGGGIPIFESPYNGKQGFVVPPCDITILKEENQMSEITIKSEIAEVFKKTEEAILVQKYLGSEIAPGFIVKLILEQNKEAILQEAKLRDKAAIGKEKSC